MNPRQGSTLIELLVVLVIIAIFAAVSIPAFTRLDAVDPVHAAADQLAEVLRAAREVSIAAAWTTTVTIDPSTGRYWIIGGPEVDSTLAIGHVDLPADTKIMASRPRLAVTFRRGTVATGDAIILIAPSRMLMVSADPWSAEVGIRGQ